jgi:hypothetical protein
MILNLRRRISFFRSGLRSSGLGVSKVHKLDVNKEYDLSNYSLLIYSRMGMLGIDLVPRLVRDSLSNGQKNRGNNPKGPIIIFEEDSSVSALHLVISNGVLRMFREALCAELKIS